MTPFHPTNLSPAAESREIAAIDLGSNSFHLIVARINQGNVQILSRFKQKVQLAEGLNDKLELSQAAIERGVGCLALFAERLQGFRPEDVTVVGTYTLRSAVNNQAFLQQARAVFPYDINIISGETEAVTIYAGVCHTQSVNGRKLVIDIGGGSTEMVIGDGFEPLAANSRHMGCVSFAKRFFPHGNISPERFNQAYQAARATIADLAEPYRKLGWQTVLGSSGTIKTVHQVIAAGLDPNGIITVERLQTLIDHTLQAPHFNDLHINGLNPERVDVFVPGLAILKAVFDTYRIHQMRYSDGALREGIIYGIERGFQTPNIRARTVEGLCRQFSIDRPQAARVAATADGLCRQHRAWHQVQHADDMADILQWAATLHELGIAVNFRHMQKHGAYILNNMDLPGFDREQQRLLTTLIRFQTGQIKTADIGKSTRYAAADIHALIRLLRLAVLLNRSRQATEKSDEIRLKTDRTSADWQLQIDPDYLRRNPLIHHELQQERHQWQDIGWGLTLSGE